MLICRLSAHLQTQLPLHHRTNTSKHICTCSQGITQKYINQMLPLLHNCIKYQHKVYPQYVWSYHIQTTYSVKDMCSWRINLCSPNNIHIIRRDKTITVHEYYCLPGCSHIEYCTQQMHCVCLITLYISFN